MTVQPYLFFEGRCEEAIGFYKDAVGAEVVTVSYTHLTLPTIYSV